MPGRWRSPVGWGTAPRTGPRPRSVRCGRSWQCGRHWCGRGRATSACSARDSAATGCGCRAAARRRSGRGCKRSRCPRRRTGWSHRCSRCSGPSTSRPSWRRSSRAGVAGHAAGRRLCTVPGVGPVTAAAVVATLDDVGRFVSAGRWRSSDASFCAPACGASDGRDDDGAARQGTHGSHHTRGDGRLAAPLRIRSGMLPAGKHSRRTTTGSQFRSAEALQCHGPSYSPSSCS